MNFKELFYKCVDFIDIYKKNIITVSLSVLGVIVLVIVFFISSDELSVQKEVDTLLENIENRRYNIAIDNYSNYEKKFSDSKMKRIDKTLSKKINKLLLESGDKYVNKEITKEQYVGMINTINAIENIEVDVGRIIEQSQRVSDMYKEENTDYDTALSYISMASTLNGISNELDGYKSNIEQIHESRLVYEKANENKENHMYYEAIQDYDKVLEKDDKYYKKAQKEKDECIDLMYDDYIEKADESNKDGDYESALRYIEYVKKYYPDDENILNLEKKYKEKLSIYTLSADDIINLISKKGNISKNSLSINSYYQMIDGEKYYCVEVLEYGMLTDEILVNAKTKEIYSYKDSNKDYKNTYCNGYFRYDNSGKVQFAISEEKAKFILQNKLEKNDEKYKEIYEVSKNKADRYVEDEKGLENILKGNEGLYYYEIVNKGFFRPKEAFMINMYSEKVYIISQKEIKEY